MLASHVSATGYSYNALKFLTMKTLLCMDMHDRDLKKECIEMNNLLQGVQTLSYSVASYSFGKIYS